MRVKWVVLSIVVVGLAGVGCGGYFLFERSEKEKAAQARYVATVGKIERLLADAYDPPDRDLNALKRFDERGCKEEWAKTPQSAVVRLAEAEKLALADADTLRRLRADEGAQASYALAALLMKTGVAKHDAVAGVDPEALLRRAAAKNHGHALFYFARLRAERYPPDVEESGTVERFLSINKDLELAADQGSGAAAYSLASRTRPELLAKLGLMDGQYTTSRTPREWWCRSAELGYAPGQLRCYLHGKRRAEEARKWLVVAADAGHEAAALLLGRFFETGGGGFAVDGDKAKELYCRALWHGSRGAFSALARLDRYKSSSVRKKLAH